MSSFLYDYLIRNRLGGSDLILALLIETSVVKKSDFTLKALSKFSARLSLPALAFSSVFWKLSQSSDFVNQQITSWKSLWAITPHERLRLRCILDAVVAKLYGLNRDDLHWILRDCDWPSDRVCDKRFARSLDPKGFWRVDKHQPPELRHTVLSLIAFDALEQHGLENFLGLNDGDGWHLPATVRLADHGLGHDDRAQSPQSVAAALGDRHLPWQHQDSPERSWDECRRHAALLDALLRPGDRAAPPPSSPQQLDLLNPHRQGTLFD